MTMAQSNLQHAYNALEIQNLENRKTIKKQSQRIKELEEALAFDSKKLIGSPNVRFKELAHKEFHWSSFYNGWLEGRVKMLNEIKK